MKILKLILISAGDLVVSFFLGFYMQAYAFQMNNYFYVIFFIGAIASLLATALEPRGFAIWAVIATVGTIIGAMQVNMGEGNLMWAAFPLIIFGALLTNILITGAAVLLSNFYNKKLSKKS